MTSDPTAPDTESAKKSRLILFGGGLTVLILAGLFFYGSSIEEFVVRPVKANFEKLEKLVVQSPPPAVAKPAAAPAPKPERKPFVGCAQIDGPELPGFDQPPDNAADVMATIGDKFIVPLKSAYQRISTAAKIKPALFACNNDALGLNAVASGTAQYGIIIFDLPMLQLLDGNEDETAAVMAHELSHVLLDHSRLGYKMNSNLASRAQTVALDNYQKSGSVKKAINRGKLYFDVESARFSRIMEREADDKGFSMAVILAKYDADGFKSFVKKMMRRFPSSGDRPLYLNTHPGFLERLDKADILIINQKHTDFAQALYNRGDWDGLSEHLKTWLDEIPDSGAAWYYQGRLIARTTKSPAKISMAYEKAVSFYSENATLGVRSQEDQGERDDAWFYLSMALLDEGYENESRNCLRRISSKEKFQALQSILYPGISFVSISGMTEPREGNLLAARKEDGGKLFTNDRATAASYQPNQPIPPVWKAFRFPSTVNRPTPP